MDAERIDVLAVMDREIDAIRNTKAIADVGLCGARKAAYAEHLSNMEEARAAVAELIEAVADRKIAARRLWLAKSESDKALLSSARAALKAAEDRETAALARVGGA